MATPDNEIKHIIHQAKGNRCPQEKQSHISIFLTWIGSQAAHFPDDVFRLKEGLFVKQEAIDIFLREYPSFSKPSLLAELENKNVLIFNNNDIYHFYAPTNFANRKVIKGILVNMDGLPQFSLMKLNRSYQKEICS